MMAHGVTHLMARPSWILSIGLSINSCESWNDAVRRAENGETVAVIAHGKHVADLVSSG